MRIFSYLIVFFTCFGNNILAQNYGVVKSNSNYKSKIVLEKASNGSYYKFSKSTMCRGVQSVLPWEPVNEAQSFVPIDSAAIAWVELTDIYVPIRVKWIFEDPKSNIYFESLSDWTTNPASAGYDHWSWWKLWSWIYIDGFPPADQVNWGDWKVDIFVEENYSGVWLRENTLSFRIDGYNVQINDILNDTVPKDFSLFQNYPNPFNSSTIISYSIPEANKVSLILYDVLGTKLKTLLNEDKSPGIDQFEFFAQDLPSGMYFYEFKVGNFMEIKKFVLLR